MINANRTGAFISALRKERDWTQLELAEKLHVTHQAVSRWEKGDSFPDISVLPPLARLLGVTVDDLLNGGPAARGLRVTAGALVEELAQGHAEAAARIVRDDPEAGIDAVLDSVPLARPSIANDFVSQLQGIPFQPEHIAGLAPFVSQEALEALVVSADLTALDGELLTQLAPFLGSSTLDRLVARAGEVGLTTRQLASVAPFLSQSTLQDLSLRVIQDEELSFEVLRELVPFLGQETLTVLLERLPEGALDADFIAELAPFLGQDHLERLIGRLADSADLREHLPGLAPFLRRETLRKVVIAHQAHLSADDIVAIAPFLDKDSLTALIRAISSAREA